MPNHSTEGHNVIEQMRALHPIHRELFQRYVARAEAGGVTGGAFNDVDWDAAIELVKSSVRILVRDIELPPSFWNDPAFAHIPKEDRAAYVVMLQWNVTPLPQDVIDSLSTHAASRRFCDNEAYDRALAAMAAEGLIEPNAKH